MLEIIDETTTAAPPEEVWKLLYDPARFTTWWEGVQAVEPEAGDRFLLRGTDDAILPQRLRADSAAGRVTVSCLVRGVEFQWSLTPLDGGGTRIAARCSLPEREAARLPAQRAAIATSLRRLGDVAATGAPREPG